jgi:hypothetical protein
MTGKSGLFHGEKSYRKKESAMKNKVFAVTLAVLATAASIGCAAPQTSWDQGEWQMDLGAWAPTPTTGI